MSGFAGLSCKGNLWKLVCVMTLLGDKYTMKVIAASVIVMISIMVAYGSSQESDKPTEFNSYDISQEFIQFFKENCEKLPSETRPSWTQRPTKWPDTTHAMWTQSPIHVALKLLGLNPLTRDSEISLDVTVDKAWVHIHEKVVYDDSTREMYTIIEFKQIENENWLPVNHKACWKGRGLKGWSTELPH